MTPAEESPPAADARSARCRPIVRLLTLLPVIILVATLLARGGELNAVAPVSYTHLRAHETVLDLVCRLLLGKKNTIMYTCTPSDLS